MYYYIKANFEFISAHGGDGDPRKGFKATYFGDVLIHPPKYKKLNCLMCGN